MQELSVNIQAVMIKLVLVKREVNTFKHFLALA